MKFRHVCFIVTNIDNSTKFYRKFGFKVFKRKRIKGTYVSALFGEKKANIDLTYVKMYIDKDKNTLELIQFHSPKGDILPNKNHIALTVENLEGLYSSLSKKEIKFISPPLQATDSEVKVCFCIDNDKNMIELVED